MLSGVNGKIALVCASTKGLGFGTARALAELGATVWVNGRHSQGVDEAISRLQNDLPQADFRAAPGDVTTVEGRQAILNVCGAVDILVNNAGGPPPGFFEDWDEQDWLQAVEQNMIAPIMLTKALTPAMSAKGWGRVVNITSGSVKSPIPHLGLSNGARAGLTGAMAGISRQLAPKGITINNVLPGQHETDRLRANYTNIAARTGVSFDDAWATGKKNHPTGCFGDASDFGAVVAFLCSDQAKFIVGQNIMVDGGAANITL